MKVQVNELYVLDREAKKKKRHFPSKFSETCAISTNSSRHEKMLTQKPTNCSDETKAELKFSLVTKSLSECFTQNLKVFTKRSRYAGKIKKKFFVPSFRSPCILMNYISAATSNSVCTIRDVSLDRYIERKEEKKGNAHPNNNR